jgi:MoxR-like ATPase
MVMATQNPIEQEGTYPLPEAQLDRFLLYVRIDYPAAENEREILRLSRTEARGGRQEQSRLGEPLSQLLIRSARNEVLDLYMTESLERYLLEIVLATRNPGKYGDDLSRWLQYGASPRATIALDRVSRARAWLDGRDYVSPEDIQEMVKDVLGHRIVLSYEAEAEGMSADAFLDEMMSRIAVP